MHKFICHRRTLPFLVATSCLVVTVLSLFASARPAFAASRNAYVPLSGSYSAAPAGARLLGARASDEQQSVTLVLQPRNSAQLNAFISALYNPRSSQFHHWLSQGEFNWSFAPTAAQTARVRNYLTNAGLKLAASPSPFLVRATGTTAQIQSVFRTHLNNYVAASGKRFYRNSEPARIPASLSDTVMGISGLSNTSTLHASFVRARQAARATNKAAPKYGAGPGGSGLTPSQLSSLYGATPAYQSGSRGQGQGATLAVFEQSGYTRSDIATYERQFFGQYAHIPLIDVNVDGGPITPACPAGDMCGPFTEPGSRCANGCNSADYSGDTEVEADIEVQIAMAPKISRILVYNAPNDMLGVTSVDEYFQIANDDVADAISTSWGLCEKDIGLDGARAEAIAFTQMAAQGQSIFDAAGDTGAYDCLGGSGYRGIQAEDPSTQPFVTSVGGTSFGSYDPGQALHPTYPVGAETVWNTGNACSSASKDQCAELGADGGGVSMFWSMPSYQYGPGVITPYSQKAPYCSEATTGQYCRQVSDVSANADAYTPYAEYCTGNPRTNSDCATYPAQQAVPGWFGLGGTSLASPLWSGIIALWDSAHGARFGSANYGLYQMLRSGHAYSRYFHDITGIHQTENNNGYYPTTRAYDMATGIGTPRIAGIVGYNF